MTPREIVEQHPEWADLPIVVPSEDGGYDFVGSGAGLIYTDDVLTAKSDTDLSPMLLKVLVLAPN